MSLEKIDKFIEELESIKYFDVVKGERDEALREVKELKRDVSVLKKRLNKITRERGSLKKKLNEKEEEEGRLREALKLKDEELQSSKFDVEGLRNRILELENLKAGVEDKTLGEAEEIFLQAREAEIEKRTDELFNSMKARWEKSEKWKEVYNEAVKQLKNIIETLRKPGPQYFQKETLNAGLPQKVEGMIKSDVDRRLNEEFRRRVEEKSNQKALNKLNHLKKVEWPGWWRGTVEPKARELESRIKANALNLLMGPWNISCDKCGITEQIKLTPPLISNLLKHGHLLLECANPNCRNIIGRHKIKTELESLISHYIGQPTHP